MATQDVRLTEVDEDRTEELTEGEKTTQDLVDKSDAAYDEAIAGVDEWKTQSEKVQREQTDLAIEKLEQNQEWARQDYIKEQSGAYKDWQKQSNPYGVHAEQVAAQGMSNTGYAESLQVSMYNTYQNRVAVARQSFERSNVEFELAIKEAKVQNSVALAEIALKAYEQKASLIIQKTAASTAIWQNWITQQNAINSRYDTKWATVLDQINTEAALAETKRHNEETEAAARAAQQLERAKFDWQKQQANKSSSGGGGGSSGGGGGTTINKTPTDKKGAKVKGKDSSTIRETKEKNKITIDTKSVLALGYGPISGEKLAQLVNEGKVRQYVEDGKYKFEKVWAPTR